MLLKSDLDDQQTGLRGGIVLHLSRTQEGQQSVTKVISVAFVKLVTPKTGDMREHLFKKSAIIFQASRSDLNATFANSGI